MAQPVETVHVLLGERDHRFREGGDVREGLRFHEVVFGGELGAQRIGGLEDGADVLRGEGEIGVGALFAVGEQFQMDAVPIHQLQAGGRNAPSAPGLCALVGERAACTLDGLRLQRPIQKHFGAGEGRQRRRHLVREGGVVRHPRHQQPLAQERLVRAYRQGEFHHAFGVQVLALQIVLELRHVVGADGEDVERFQEADMLGMLAVQGAAAFQPMPQAAQAHAASEQLDDLRTFAAADVHQPHAGNAPGVPALHELAGAHQHFDGGVRRVDAVEEAVLHRLLLHQYLRRALGHQFAEAARVADGDHAEVAHGVVRLQADLAARSAHEAEAQHVVDARVEDVPENVSIQRLRRQARIAQRTETALEHVPPVRAFQAALARQQAADAGHRPAAGVVQHAVQKAHHREHVALLAPVAAVHGVHRAADEHPQRALQVVGAQGVLVLGEHPLLFVEGKQIAEQQAGRAFLGILRFVFRAEHMERRTGVFQVQDVEILAEAVAVEVTVGVVEGDGLGVFAGEFLVAGGGERLAEGGAVFEGEAGFRQRVPIAAPAFAAGALVPFVHEDQVVALERLHGHGEPSALLHLRELGDFDDAHGVFFRANVQAALA